MIFIKKTQILEKKIHFNLLHLIFLLLLLLHKKGSQNVQGFALIQADLFGFRKLYVFSYLLIAPTFVTKVTEYLCAGWVFFLLQTSIDF